MTQILKSRSAALEMCVTHNIRIRPKWEFVDATCGWKNGGVDEVVAYRLGPDGIYIGKAFRENEEYTVLSVEFMPHHKQFRRIERTIKVGLRWLDSNSMTQYWGRMITAAKKWPVGMPC